MHIVFNQIQFILQILKRFFIILFRKKKNIQFIQLNYSDKYLFNNSIIVINYRFRNAIYYKFGVHKTADNHVKIFNVDKIKPKVTLTVYGFFRKQHYVLKLEPENILITTKFKTEFSNLNNRIVFKEMPQSFTFNIFNRIQKLKVNILAINVETKPLKRKYNSFNQSDFL